MSMNYRVIRFAFNGGVHLGSGQLSDSSPVLLADTLFSALCHEAVSAPGGLNELLGKVRDGKVLLSDAFPYIGSTFYIPKPFISIRKEDEGDSKKKKAFKKLKYIPIDKMDVFLAGNLDATGEVEKLNTLGRFELRTNVTLDRNGESTPYHVGVYHFNINNGLYCILGYETEEDLYYMEDLFISLGYTGIGGRRSTGLGGFSVYDAKCPSSIQKRFFGDDFKTFTSLSLSLPKEDELEAVIENGSFQVVKRSGFVASEQYADEFRKKKDLYAFAAGSVTKKKYQGDIYDVSDGGRHPVYRYAIPMFIGVE